MPEQLYITVLILFVDINQNNWTSYYNIHSHII